MTVGRSVLILACLFGMPAASPPGHKTRNIIFIMTDGLRWQEVFNGADPKLINKPNGGVTDVEGLRRAYWRDDVKTRREVLMPFLWSMVAKHGQIFGNRSVGSEAFVTNGHNFSYPGYNETLCGFADPRINSNEKNPNPNVTVLEWLNHMPAYRGRVAAFAAWDTFPFILNAQRAGFFVNAGYDAPALKTSSPQMKMVQQLKGELPRIWNNEAFDALTFHPALDYLKQSKPRILFLSLGETDEWAHAGNYAQYLEAAHRVDAYLRVLWETVQSMRDYRGTTTFIFSPDHGRGEAPDQWKSHGKKIPDSKYIWMAFLGPDTRALGERSRIGAVTQSQIAATLAALLGENYSAAVPNAGGPLRDVLPQ